jgi:hypothetical protein
VSFLRRPSARILPAGCTGYGAGQSSVLWQTQDLEGDGTVQPGFVHFFTDTTMGGPCLADACCTPSTEICDGADNDCDGLADEDCSDETVDESPGEEVTDPAPDDAVDFHDVSDESVHDAIPDAAGEQEGPAEEGAASPGGGCSCTLSVQVEERSPIIALREGFHVQV